MTSDALLVFGLVFATTPTSWFQLRKIVSSLTNIQLHRFARLAILIGLTFASLSIRAAEEIRPPQTIKELFGPKCISVVNGFTEMKDVQSVFALRPISSLTVCACVEKNMEGDRYLSLSITKDLTTFKAEAAKRNFVPYLTGKLFGYILTCLGSEFDQSAEAVRPSGEN